MYTSGTGGANHICRVRPVPPWSSPFFIVLNKRESLLFLSHTQEVVDWWKQWRVQCELVTTPPSGVREEVGVHSYISVLILPCTCPHTDIEPG